jgi:hypothetical protein
MERLHEQYIVDESGKKTAVVLPVEWVRHPPAAGAEPRAR